MQTIKPLKGYDTWVHGAFAGNNDGSIWQLSRHVNGPLKTKERARRSLRMIELIKKGNLPYTPPIMSWLSGQLDKPSRLITADDVKKVVS